MTARIDRTPGVDSPLKHQRIIANAGSGKTHRLTTRYIELLERDVEAEHIVALTFTRKAAGEFLDAIFSRLLNASASGEAARDLARETRMPGITSVRCLAHLRQLVDKLPLLTLGTIDSFFGRVLRAFPFECGIASEVRIIDDHLQSVLRRQVLAEIFRDQLGDATGFGQFLDLIRQQSRNREGRDVSGALAREIESLHERFLLTPTNKLWGDSSTIWPQGSPLLEAGNLSQAVEGFARELFGPHGQMAQIHSADWQNHFDEMHALSSGSPASEKLINFALQALDPPVDKSKSGHFSLKGPYKICYAFPDRLRQCVVALGRAILGAELESRLTRSRALHQLLARFDSRYQLQVRENGQLTFLDVAGLLAAASGSNWGAKSIGPFSRQEMNFRLDSSFDHWLLDEFQDTSRLQWEALHDLVDEVIQSDSGRRSFFYVGDTKQAIYVWRGGDPELFDEVSDFYNAAGTQRIDTREALEVSFRSVPEILDAVNTIFSPNHLVELAPKLAIPETVLGRWRSAWRDHIPHEPLPGRGYFEWRTLEVSAKKTSVPLLDEEAARLIAEIDPLAKGWSCAVLVRTNPRILTVIDALRKAGLPATSEGRIFPCQDSDVAAGLLALLNAIAHPLDNLSREHVMMTPLAKFAQGDPNDFRRSVLTKIRQGGFQTVLADWLVDLDLPERSFAKDRAEELLKAATEFDAASQGRAGLDEFVSFARGFVSSENPADNTIRVLTVHAAKGLDFDMVVLPDIDSHGFSSRRDPSVHLHHDSNGEVKWALELPPEKICAVDPVLREAWQAESAKDCYENVCLSYVAVTRARRGLYILSRRLEPKSTSKDFNRLLHGTFPRTGIALGNYAWHIEFGEDRGVSEAPALPVLSGPRLPDLGFVRPSKTSTSPIFAASFFSEADTFAVGSEVHRTLAQISWFDEGLPDFKHLSPAAEGLIASFLQTNIAERLFTRPTAACSLWREKAFDVLLDGQWISGVFDRVVIYQTESGRSSRAEIYDFKSDVDLDPEIYRRQMSLYRKCLCSLLALSETTITCHLIAIRTGEEITLASPARLEQMTLFA